MAINTTPLPENPADPLAAAFAELVGTPDGMYILYTIYSTALLSKLL